MHTAKILIEILINILHAVYAYLMCKLKKREKELKKKTKQKYEAVNSNSF